LLLYKKNYSKAPMSINNSKGTLYIVATPIGNMEDITYRAVNILKSVAMIFAEDTRTFARIKKQFDIGAPSESYHEHNENARTKRIMELLEEGKSIALVSDAGTPLISDPGFRVVRACKDAGYTVSPVPGACAAIAALSASGMETDQFIFLGFLPVKGGKKKKILEDSLALNTTIVCYESTHRIIKTITLLNELVPDRNICCAREITKIYEDIYTAKPQEVLQHLEHETSIKGEFVLIIGKEPKKIS
jgi:16S rRNA (cytidine1402-2'-O)-methyltransferase